MKRELLSVGVDEENLKATGRDVNLLDREAVEHFLRSFKPNVVIHAAALCGGIGMNRARPAEMFHANLMMGVPLMEACRRNDVDKFVALGTICAYPKYAGVPFSESEMWDGYPEETNAPYGLAKKMLLVQAQAYRAQYGFNAIYLLPANLYGPGDHFDLENSHVIPAMIRKFTEAVERGHDCVVLWGDGSPTREFLYVADAARAIVAASGKYDGPDPVNIGSGMSISIVDLAVKIAALCGYSGKIVWDDSRPNGQPRRCLDTRRALRLFGWEATTSFDSGLKATVEWYRANKVAVDRT